MCTYSVLGIQYFSLIYIYMSDETGRGAWFTIFLIHPCMYVTSPRVSVLCLLASEYRVIFIHCMFLFTFFCIKVPREIQVNMYKQVKISSIEKYCIKLRRREITYFIINPNLVKLLIFIKKR
jgi:hypothetical protein